MSKHETETPPVPEDGPQAWDVFDKVFEQAAETLPALGLCGSSWSALHVRRVHGPALIAAGAARKTQSGRWLAHRKHLAPALFELLTGAPDAVLAAARRRSESSAQAPTAVAS